MFGDRKELILPLVLDIANLVRMAAESNDAAQPRSAHKTFAGGEKFESLPSAEFLQAEPAAEPNVPNSAMNDDRLSIDMDDEPEIMDTAEENHNNNEQRAFHITRSAPFYDHLLKKMVPSFRSAGPIKKQPILQRRIDSGCPPGLPSNLPLNQKPFVVPSSSATLPATTPRSSPVNESYNQVEDLALNGLNGTYVDDADAQESETIMNLGDVDEEDNEEQLPMAEKLIGGRYRKKPHSRYSHRKPGLSLSSASLCEKFTGSVCLRVEDYPM